MTIVLLMMLAAVWAAVLLPPFLRKRAEVRPSASISSFRNHLLVLERTLPGGRSSHGRPANGLRRVPTAEGTLLLVPGTTLSRPRSARSQIRRRRQQVLLGLLGADTALVMLVGLGVGAVGTLGLLVSIAATGTYMALLARTQRLAAERRLKLRHLPRPVVMETAMPVRRTAAL